MKIASSHGVLDSPSRPPVALLGSFPPAHGRTEGDANLPCRDNFFIPWATKAMVTSWDGRGARRGGSTCGHGLAGKDALRPGDGVSGKCERLIHGKGTNGGRDAASTVQCHGRAAWCLALRSPSGVLGYHRRFTSMGCGRWNPSSKWPIPHTHI